MFSIELSSLEGIIDLLVLKVFLSHAEDILNRELLSKFKYLVTSFKEDSEIASKASTCSNFFNLIL